jgi:hypothetical protein
LGSRIAAQILWVRIAARAIFFFLLRKEITERDGTVWGRCGRRIAQVWTVSLPVVVLNSPAVSDPASTTKSNPAFGTARDVVGIVLWAVGLAIETVSDAQKVRRPFLPFVFFGASARRCGETEWLGFQLHYKLNNPPKDKPYTVREPHSSPGTC